jgi:hypothetical protein
MSPVRGDWSLGGGNEQRKSAFVPYCRACVEISALGWVNAEIARSADGMVLGALSGSRLVLRCGLRSQSAFSSGCGLAGSAIIGWCVANISCYRGRLPSQYTHRYREAGACIHRCNGRASCTRRMWPPIQVPRGPDRCSRRRGSPSRTMAAPESGPALHLTCASLRV